jgi:hypothetical protein
MATSVLHSLLPAFKERNHILALLLGATALLDRWMRLLESEACAARQDDHDPDSSIHSGAEQGLMFFLLGSIHFSNNFHALIQAYRQAPDDNSPLPDAPTASIGLSDLLR